MRRARGICVAVMLASAIIGMLLAIIANDFSTPAIVALCVGLLALLVFSVLWLIERSRAGSARGSPNRR